MYTTWGSVRGDCGHVHGTREAAQRCLERDRRGCAEQGGYSDREVRAVSGRRDIESYDVLRGPGMPA